MATSSRLFAVLLLLVLSVGCAHDPPRFDPVVRRTYLVLSVGGPRGIAHIGAIQAVQEARIPIGCVVGNSMGALVGGLYASAPTVDPDARFRQLIDLYLQETKSDVRKSLVASVEGVFSRTLAVRTVGLVNYDRFKRTLDEMFGLTRIESLPVPFATFYAEGTATGIEVREVRGGLLGEEVSRSIANPLIFPALAIKQGGALDPGSDRILATPVEGACAMFPDANLLVINVTDDPIISTARMKCPVLEIRVNVPPPNNVGDAFVPGPIHDQLVEAGRAATRAALAHR